jgi:catechol 2,3-dioxygenase-like lactoylglutathione lyase family enzyme
MRIKLTSLMVNDQNKALRFYTDVLGFRKRHEIPLGGDLKWLTVISPDGPDDIELSLEPNSNPAGKAFQEAMFAQGIPVAAFEVADMEREYGRLKSLGVVFTREPVRSGPIILAIFSDSCGNLIQIYQPK